MSSNFFPMLSSSPPPIDDVDNEDDDDDYGNFASADTCFDSSFDSPIFEGNVKSFKSNSDISDSKVNKLNVACNYSEVGDCLCNSEDKNLHDGIGIHQSISCDAQNQEIGDKFINSKCAKDIIKESQNSPYDEMDNECEELKKLCQQCTLCDKDESCNCSIKSHQHQTEINNVEHTNELLCKSITESDPKLFLLTDVSHCTVETFVKNEENDLPEDNIQIVHSKLNSHVKLYDDENSVDGTIIEEDGNSEILGISDKIRERYQNESETLDDFKNECVPVEDKSKLKFLFEEGDVSLNIPPEECEGDDLKAAQSFIIERDSSITDDGEVRDHTNVQKSQEVWDKDDESINKGDTSHFNSFVCSWSSDKLATSESDEFADFETAKFDGEESFAHSGSCEFSDFESASFYSSAEAPMFTELSTPVVQEQEKSSSKISAVMNTIFPISDTCFENTSEEHCSEVFEQNNKSRRLWDKLNEVEQTPGFRFQWTVSHSFQQLLRSINVDYHSILRMSSVPIFASGLSLLEPMKGPSGSTVNHDAEDSNQSPKEPIPPVEFDWNSSGLINPLDSVHAASTLMDLTFLCSTEAAATTLTTHTSSNSFENELLKPGLHPDCSDKNSQSIIIEQLLSNNACSFPNSRQTNRPLDLSQEAVHVLDQLPDLSFMCAKVLMFPICNKT